MKLVFDTNVYTEFAEGIPEVVEFIVAHGDQLYVPAIVLGELHFGFMKGSRRAHNERKLYEFLSNLSVTVINVDSEVARKYAVIFLSLQKRGTKIPINDVWIAASCMSVGGTLLTRDSHFDAVDQLDKVAP
jgi:predicted nucleic acid-binding protein